MKRPFKNCLPLLAAFLFLFFTGCGGDDPEAITPVLKLEKVSGDNQEGKPGQSLPIPVKVKFVDQDGAVQANKFIEFLIVSGNGALSATKVLSDQNGMAEVTWTLGLTAPVQTMKAFVLDAGNQPIPSTVVEFTAKFMATTYSLQKISGDNQDGSPGQALSQPLKVKLMDQDGIAVAN